jgi:predicted ATPase/DNA-binding XRE family transcriptional regulator/Tfp pilus assembly protein PilF
MSRVRATFNFTDTLPSNFGEALRFLRKRARLTQDELGLAVGYSREQIARLENGSRLPDLAVVAALFIPALELKSQSLLAQQLLELAGQTRAGGATHQKITITRTVKTRVQRALEVTSENIPHFNLPAPLFPILGRGAELEALADLLTQEARLVTLVGAPGIGKTRLALELAHLLKTAFADGVSFVGLESVQRAAEVPGAVAAALGLTPSAAQPVSDQIRSFLAHRKILLALDNCEHILDAAVDFGEWLSAAPGLKLLCTSRVAIDLYGEYTWDVAPLAQPDLAHLPPLDELAQVAAVKLFVARARAANPTFTLTSENALAVAALCVALDGLPLTLEIAAARIRDLPVQDLLQKIVTARKPMPLSSSLLQQTRRNLAERHQTLNNAIAWSFRLLPPAAQQVFLRLGVMAGGGTLQAVEKICGATSEILADLSAASLARQTDGRVTLLETLRAFACEQLAAENLLTETRHIHAAYFADLAGDVFKGILGPEQETWLANARRDHDNFRLALSFAIEQADSALAVTISGSLWWFWNRQGFIREGRGWLEQSLALPAPRPLDETQKRSRATALNGAGSICTELGEFDSAMRYHEEGLALRYDLEDTDGISVVLHNMGLVERSRGAYPAALRIFEEALALTDPQNTSSLAMSYTNLGMTALMMYDLPLAANWLERSLAILTPADFPWETAYTCNVYTNACFEAGQLDRAETLARESQTLFETLGDAIFLPEPQLMRAKIAHARGDLETARALCTEVFRQYQQMDDQYGVANVLYVLAWLELPADPARARALFSESQTLRNAQNHFLSPLEQTENQRLQAALEAGERKGNGNKKINDALHQYLNPLPP